MEGEQSATGEHQPDQYSPVGQGDKTQLIGDGSVAQGSEVSPLQMENECGNKGTPEGLKIIIISSVTFAIAITVALIATIYLGPPQVPPTGSVSSDIKQCSAMGAEVIEEKGGSSVDAAIITALCTGVINGHSSGIGGGGFMIVRDNKLGTVSVFDYRETAPAASTRDMFVSQQEASNGGKSVAVPGELKGLAAAHEQYGEMSWKDLVTPVAELARNGFNVTRSLAEAIQSNSELIAATPELNALYGGKKEGDIIRRPDLAAVLDRVAEEGTDAFYTGSVAQSIVDAVKSGSNPGVLTADNLSGYTVSQPNPISQTFKEITIEGVPPPAAGAVIMSALNIIENSTLPTKGESSYYHLLIEALKYAQAQQVLLGDPSYEKSVVNITDRMISKDWAMSLAMQITDITQNTNYYLNAVGATGMVQAPALIQTPKVEAAADDSQISIIGADEIIVSITSSINAQFGSGVVTSTGIILNNQMASFSLPEKGKQSANYIAGGKRPQATLSPIIIHAQRRPCEVRGGMGGERGRRTTSGVSQAALNIFGFGDNLSKGIEEPRMFPDLTQNKKVEYEDYAKKTFVPALITNLTVIHGHDMAPVTEPFNIVNAALKRNETLDGHTDYRKEGVANGNQTVIIEA